MKYVYVLLFVMVGMLLIAIPVRGESGREWRSPAEFLALMERSDVTYIFKRDPHLERFRLNRRWEGDFPISPYARVKTGAGKKRRVVVENPNKDIEAIYKKSSVAFKRKRYDELVELYKKALAIDPGYAPTWTFLGNTYFMQDDYRRAIDAFKKAIELNPQGYQAYYFMADTYDRMGKEKKALEAITHAYMLDKNNPRIRASLERILRRNGFRVHENRLTFPFHIQRESKDECMISHANDDAMAWLALSNCLACWQMEPELRKLHGDGVNLDMYRECLMNQFASSEMKRRDGKKLLPREARLLNVVKEDLLDAMVYWEIGAGMQPDLMLVAPHDLQKDTLRYLRKYVFTKV